MHEHTQMLTASQHRLISEHILRQLHFIWYLIEEIKNFIVLLCVLLFFIFWCHPSDKTFNLSNKYYHVK